MTDAFVILLDCHLRLNQALLKDRDLAFVAAQQQNLPVRHRGGRIADRKILRAPGFVIELPPAGRVPGMRGADQLFKLWQALDRQRLCKRLIAPTGDGFGNQGVTAGIGCGNHTFGIQHQGEIRRIRDHPQYRIAWQQQEPVSRGLKEA